MTDTETTAEPNQTFGIGMVATYIGERTRDDGFNSEPWKHNLWHITLLRNDQQMTTEFRMGLGLINPPKRKSMYGYRQPGWVPYGKGYRSDELPTPQEPKLIEVLYSVASDARLADDPYDQDDLLGDLPYSKARLVVAACETIAADLRRLLGRHYDEFINQEWDV